MILWEVELVGVDLVGVDIVGGDFVGAAKKPPTFFGKLSPNW